MILSDGYRDRAWVDFSSYFLGLARYDETMTTQIHVYGGPIADGLAYYGIPKADVEATLRSAAPNPIQRPEETENSTSRTRAAPRVAAHADVDAE